MAKRLSLPFGALSQPISPKIIRIVIMREIKGKDRGSPLFGQPIKLSAHKWHRELRCRFSHHSPPRVSWDRLGP